MSKKGKVIYNRKSAHDKILSGIEIITAPVVSTLSPRGNNVIVESDSGHFLTNDGVVIARSINSDDAIENAVINIIKEASLKTNAEAGDGTTTTVLLSSVLIKESLKLVEDGMSWIDLKGVLDNFTKKLISNIEKTKIVVKNDIGLKEIATTSANNDPEIAKYVLEAIKVAREDGLVFIESSNSEKTEVIKDLGFMVKSGVMYPELLSGHPSALFEGSIAILTDKNLYYAEEADTLLRTALKAKQNSIVIVAKDFSGSALNTLIANHDKKVINVMLIKYPNTDVLYDLATYINAKVFTDKTGSLVNNVKIEDFTVIPKVYSDRMKTLFTPQTTQTNKLKERIKDIRSDLLKNKESVVLKERLASLTTGLITIRVSGNTPIEIREKIFRYEDAINATRSAMKYGYVVGGGTSILKAFNPKDYQVEFVPMLRRYTESIVRQIARNCGKHEDSMVEEIKRSGRGYNALTDKYEDLKRAGIIDPFQVIKLAILNSVSVTKVLTSVNYFITDHEEETD